MARRELDIYTVYFNPSDYPGLYVVRKFKGERPTDELYTGKTIEDVRLKIPEDKRQIGRMPGDDPVIVETWL